MKKMIARIKALKTRNKVFLSIGVLLLVLIVLGAVLPSADEEDEASTPEATPTEVSSSPTIASEPPEDERTATPTPPPATSEATPEAPTASATVSVTPTPTAEPVTAVCGDQRVNAGTEYSYNPDEETAEEATDRVCGGVIRTSTCANNRENGGKEYSYNTNDETAIQAINRVCGPRLPPSAWTTGRSTDELTRQTRRNGRTEATSFDVTGSGFGSNAYLFVQCYSDSNDLDAYIAFRDEELFSYVYVAGTYNEGIRVQYRFDDGALQTESNWSESTTNEAVFARNPRQFINNIRNSDELMIRVIGFDDDNATLSFNLTGFDRTVDPVLDSC